MCPVSPPRLSARYGTDDPERPRRVRDDARSATAYVTETGCLLPHLDDCPLHRFAVSGPEHLARERKTAAEDGAPGGAALAPRAHGPKPSETVGLQALVPPDAAAAQSEAATRTPTTSPDTPTKRTFRAVYSALATPTSVDLARPRRPLRCPPRQRFRGGTRGRLGRRGLTRLGVAGCSRRHRESDQRECKRQTSHAEILRLHGAVREPRGWRPS